MTFSSSWVAKIDAGASYQQVFLYQHGDRPVDLTGYGAVLRLRDSDSRVFLTVDSAGPGASSLAVDAALGKLTLNLSPEDTRRAPVAKGFYEIEIYSPGVTLRILDGQAIFRSPGRGSIDTTYVVIRRDARAVTVERGVVDQLRIIDRGPPGLPGTPGAPGATGPTGDGVTKATVLVGTDIPHFGALTYDGSVWPDNTLVLDTGNSSGSARGLWLTSSSTWTRYTATAHAPGMLVAVTGGDYGAGTQWKLTAVSPFTLDATGQEWKRTDGQAIDGVVTTATRTGTLVATHRLPRGKSFRAVVEDTISTSAKTRTLRRLVAGSCATDGTVTIHREVLLEYDALDIGATKLGTTAAGLTDTAYAGSTASTTWSSVMRVRSTGPAASLPATAKVVIQEGTPDGYVNLLGYVPAEYWTDIVSYYPGVAGNTPNVDVTSYLQAGIDECAAAQEGRRNGWLPLGYYGVATRLVIPSNVTIAGCGRGKLTPAPVLYAIADRIGDAYQQALLYIHDKDGVTLKGFNIHCQSYKGDAMWLAYSNWFTLKDMVIEHAVPAANSAIIQSVTGNTINWSGPTSLLSNGMCIELWVNGVGVLPSPLAINTPYFVIGKSGHTCQLSLTSGGAAIVLTDVGTDTFGVVVNDRYITSITGGATDTINIANHPFSNGDKIRAYNRLSMLDGATAYAFPAGVSHYVVNATTNAFQVAATPNGTPLNITGAGTALGRRVARENCGTRGGANQYGNWDNVWYRNNGTALFMWTGEATGGVYVGCDTFLMREVLCNSADMFISGRGVINARSEGPVFAPNIAKFGVGGDGSRISFQSIYTETGIGAVLDCHLAIDLNIGDISGDLNGGVSNNVGAIGVFLNKPGYQTWMSGFQNLNVKGIYRKFVSDNASAGIPSSTADGPFIYSGCPGNGGAQENRLWSPQTYTNTTLYHHQVYRTGRGWDIGGSVYADSRYNSTANPTAFDTRLGNLQRIKGTGAGSTIATLTDSATNIPTGAAFGFRGTIIADSNLTKLGTGAFDTLSGAGFTLPAGVPYDVAARSDGEKLVLGQQMGTVVAGTPAALSGTLTSTVGDTALFDSAPIPGKYTVDVYGTVLTQGSGTTTLTLPLKWTDAKAGRTENMVTAFDLVAGATYFRSRLTIRVASGTPTLGATFNTPSGTPQVTLDASVTRDT